MLEANCCVTANGKIAVEMKAEHYADNGYTMVGAPYYCHARDTWVHELRKPEESK